MNEVTREEMMRFISNLFSPLYDEQTVKLEVGDLYVANVMNDAGYIRNFKMQVMRRLLNTYGNRIWISSFDILPGINELVKSKQDEKEAYAITGTFVLEWHNRLADDLGISNRKWKIEIPLKFRIGVKEWDNAMIEQLVDKRIERGY